MIPAFQIRFHQGYGKLEVRPQVLRGIIRIGGLVLQGSQLPHPQHLRQAQILWITMPQLRAVPRVRIPLCFGHPNSLDRVMNRKAGGRTGWADDPTDHKEVEPEIETKLVRGEITVLAAPEWLLAKSGWEEGFVR